MPRQQSIEPQLPSGGGLSDLDIEPPLLVDPNAGYSAPTHPSSTPFPAPAYNPSDATETPYRNPVLGNIDWIKEHWNQYDPQDSIDEALDPWTTTTNPSGPEPPMDYEHPDDSLFFSPSREISQIYNTPTYPAYRSDNYMANWGQNSSPFPTNYLNTTASSLGYGSRPGESVAQGQVLIGNEQPSGYGIPPSLNPDGSFSGTPDAPGGPILDPAGLANSTTASGGARQPAAPLAATSSPNTPQNLLGVGSQSGQHYYSTNGGATWTPVSGSAPQEVRFASNSGTGNAQAAATTKGFMLSGGYPGRANQGGDQGRTSFDPSSGWVGQINPDTGEPERVYGGHNASAPRLTQQQAASAPYGIGNTAAANAWGMAHQTPAYIAWLNSLHPQGG